MCRSKVLLLLRSGVSSLEEACTVFLMCVSKCSITKCSGGFKAIIITCASILKKYLKNFMLSTPNYSEGQSFLLIKKMLQVHHGQHLLQVCSLCLSIYNLHPLKSGFASLLHQQSSCCFCLEIKSKQLQDL